MEDKKFYTKTEVDNMMHEIRQELIKYIDDAKITKTEDTDNIINKGENNDGE